jgi:hypothetical protein
MWAERMRQDWQHTSSIVAYIVEANKAKKTGKRATPDDFNPMESNGQVQRGIPLNSQEGFAALQQMANMKPRR